MRSRITVGLMIALLVTAVTAVPSLAKPDNGTMVTKDVDCSSSIDASGLLGLDELEATESRWVEKRNGQVSKLKCRFKGLNVDLDAKVQRERDFECSAPADVEGDWVTVRSRLKVNHRGNGWLKCSFRRLD